MHSSTLYRLAVPAAALLLAFTQTPATAQQTGTIRGTVVAAATQRPVAGARVTIQGSNIGAVTNEAGRFELLNLNPGPYGVRVQYIGYSPVTQTTTLQAGMTATLDFSLVESAIQLEEVVVTGTAAEVRKKEVGNSTESITPREIQIAPLVNSQDVLVGRAPGVTVMESSGQPGSGGTIKVRGVNTISQSMQPLIYVDGVRIVNDVHSVGGNGGRTATNPLQDINVDDIDHVEVIKGAAATTLYGTEASGGVLQIFTKRGTTGAPVWNFEASAGATVAPRLGINDPTQFFMACGDTSVMYGINQARTAVYPDTTYVLGDRIYFVDPTCPASGRWQKTGPSASTALSVRGGNERVTYYLSGNYNNADGYLQTGHSKEGGFRGNFSFAPLTSLKFTLNTAYQRRDTRWVPDGNNAAGFLLNVGRGWAGNFKYGKGDDCADTPKGKLCQTNAYIFETEALSRSDHFTSGLTIEYDPTENLVNRLAVGWDYSDMSDNVVRPFGHLYTPAGSFAKGDTRLTKLSLDYAGSLNSRFGDNVSSSFSWGGQLFRDGYSRTDLATANFAGPGDPTLNTGAITAVGDRRFAGTNAGFLVQELMGFNDRFFVTAGLRVDGNSSFGSNFGLQPYPKLSLSWVLSDYGFFPKSAAFETFKLRGAIGQAGKAPGAFDKLRTWEPVAGDGGASGFAPANIGNPNVGPERTTETELGFDAGFLSGHLGIEFTAFRAKTVDALVPVDQPASLGNWNSLIDNVGDLQNEGLEASVNLGVITSRDVDWRLRASGSLLRSKVLNLGPLSVENPLAHMIAVGNNAYMKVGGPAPAYYAQYQLDNPNEYADPVILTDSLVEIGPVFPTKLLSLGTTLSLMDRVTLDGLWEFQGGMYAQNYTGQQSARRGAWWACLPFQEAYLKGGDVSGYTAFERARCAPNQRNLVVPNALDWYDIAWWTEKADFWKLRSISLSYRLPERLLPAGKSGTITIAGRNLFTLTDYTGTDPESNDAQDLYGTGSDRGAFGRRDYYQIPPGRTMVVSLRLTF